MLTRSDTERLLARSPMLAGALQRASDVQRTPTPRLELAQLAGRLIEVSTWRHGGALTLVCGWVLEAQREGEPVAWVTGRESSFFPPDLDAFGIDLEALAVVRPPSDGDLPRAADAIARADAFGLIVLDLFEQPAFASLLSTALEARLAAAAQKHHAAIVCLTHKPPQARSLGAMVSLRLHVEVRREQHGEGWFACEARALKDKRHAGGWLSREVFRGPPGLR